MNSVKRGCVLAHTLLFLYRTAMLEAPFQHVREEIYFQTRHELDLFKVSQTSTTKYFVREIIFMNDGLLVAYSTEDMQLLVDQFARAIAQLSLKILKL